jgi:hypothetical protein
MPTYGVFQQDWNALDGRARREPAAFLRAAANVATVNAVRRQEEMALSS